MRICALVTVLLTSTVTLSACNRGEAPVPATATQPAEGSTASPAESEPAEQVAPTWPAAAPEALTLTPCTVMGIELDYEGAFDPIRDMAVQAGHLVLLRDDDKLFRLSAELTPTECTLTFDPTWGSDNDGFTEFEQRPFHFDAGGARVWIGAFGGSQVLGPAGTVASTCDGSMTVYLAGDGESGVAVRGATEMQALALSDEGCAATPLPPLEGALSMREVETLPYGMGHVAWIGAGDNGSQQVVVRRDADGAEQWRYGSVEEGEDSTAQLHGIELGDRGAYLYFYNTRELRTLAADGTRAGSINVETTLAALGSAIAPADLEYAGDGVGFLRIKYYNSATSAWTTGIVLVRNM